MKSTHRYLLPVLALAVLAPTAWAEKEVTIRRLDKEGANHDIVIRKHGEPVEKEKVTFLGVETAPVNRTLAAQLGLGRDTGLVVVRVSEKSPAADMLKEDDVLTRLDDQVLVNQQQFGVLVRSKPEGTEVKLTLIRGGKEMSVKAKLGSHEVPKMLAALALPGGLNWSMGAMPEEFARLRQMPGMGDDAAKDVLRMIGREHRNFMATPGVRIYRRAGKGSTILDLPNSNISYSDESGSIDIKAEAGKRELTVKDAAGKVTFQGPINTDEERKKLPPEVVKQLEKLDNDSISFEAGEKFEQELLPLPAAPTRTKIREELRREVRPRMRSL